ncbi:MAG: nucleoside recognition domain-containing protein [Desulfobacterales bacterium]|jgi:spore maturation protein SpmA/spore maturation protein SpmB|nr:spore maturation protein [Desulfobacter sp.]MDP6394505.1 nucleoside recognition domain-containing protein [Desulfobacterales bacterium]MDP6683808.1 nucleoside recognition domain-containing protein [Desulfobacterales bacterium]MDP6806197.1 nucleoside recognition domain-containing protein [Desulfobacterales bacterium]|tara:strand:- start:96466 stop:97755 length:1290 start_codon:yes stop_codon:yes gene_type:complete
MNIIFVVIVLGAFLFAGWQQFFFSIDAGDPAPMELLSRAMVDSAGGAVELAIGLVGVMALFLGLMKVAEAGGMLNIIARLIRPLMVRLFPDVPPDHPAMGAMILNLAANALGLGNAATPFGIRAMQELDKLNPKRGTATDSMALFLAINTSSITLLPTGVIALRAAAGSSDPAAILPTTLFATIGSTTVAIMASKLYQRFASLKANAVNTVQPDPSDDRKEAPLLECTSEGYPFWVSLVALLALVTLIPVAVVFGQSLSPWILPLLMVGFLVFGMIRGVRIYEAFIEGAKDGFQVALRIIPYLVAILVAVGMLRASGALEAVVAVLGSITGSFGLPAEALPMALMRPLSGSGAYGIMASIINDPTIGPDSYTGYLVSTLQGSTETTFYVMAVYFGAVQVRRIRHALAAGLTADAAGIIFAILACSFFLN